MRGGGLPRALGLAVGVAADAIVGDPRRYHPVAGFGAMVTALEHRLYADSRSRGAIVTGICVVAALASGCAIDRLTRRNPACHATATALATWAVLGARTLRAEGEALDAMLMVGDLDGARTRLPHLVGRDPSDLDEGEIARAAVESVAENTSDAVVAPLLAGAAGGIAGLLGYRAINTLDAMIGHRSPRYAQFGWAAARLDDVANLVPARVTGLLVAVISDRPRQIWHLTRRFARQHPSPNSGWCEAAYAAALDLRLGGRNTYAGRVEVRPFLGTGRRPGAGDLRRATRLLGRLTVASTVLAAAAAASLGISRRTSTLVP